MSDISLGAAIARYLKQHGVDVVFGIPGVHNIELYRGIEAAGIEHVLARHEQGAGFMADGYARASGKPCVAFVITGPGVTNIMTPMGQAWTDSVPLLVISSCLPPDSAMPGQLHQMRDQTGAGEAVCDWSEMARDACHARALLDRAFGEFEARRPRPKHITIPIDVLAGPGWDDGKTQPWAAGAVQAAAPQQDAIGELASIINHADRPVFIFGGGARNASAAAREALALSGAAAFTTYAGRGVVDTAYPLNLGATLARPGSQEILEQADVVVVVGSELAEVDLWRAELGHRATLARIDLDRAVLDDIHNADIRIEARAEHALPALNKLLQKHNPRWTAADLQAARAAFRSQTLAERPAIAPFVDAMRQTLPDDIQIYSDMTQFAYVAKEIYPMSEPGLWHHPFGFGTLGYALPAAIGGCMASGGRPVVAVAGDYGFQYTIQELGVVAELSLPMVIVLWDNGKLKEIEDCMVRSQIKPNAVIARNPDFGLLAASYDIAYEKCDDPAAFSTALLRALERTGPTLVHVAADPTVS